MRPLHFSLPALVACGYNRLSTAQRFRYLRGSNGSTPRSQAFAGVFQIKICGITSVDDALAASAAGADCVGLNFVASSPRCLTLERAREISQALASHVRRVGLFVNDSADRICEIATEAHLDYVQLHGDQSHDILARLADWPVIKAFRVRGADAAPIADFMAEAARRNLAMAAILLDAYDTTQFGGTGKRFDWQAVAKSVADERATWPPIVLAGGLRQENVAEAIHTIRPAAVDVASGVESSAGKKDPSRVAAFVAAARDAFHALGREPAAAREADRARAD